MALRRVHLHRPQRQVALLLRIPHQHEEEERENGYDEVLFGSPIRNPLRSLGNLIDNDFVNFIVHDLWINNLLIIQFDD